MLNPDDMWTLPAALTADQVDEVAMLLMERGEVAVLEAAQIFRVHPEAFYGWAQEHVGGVAYLVAA